MAVKAPPKVNGNKGKKSGAKATQPKQGRNEYAYLKVPGNKQVHQETTAATQQQYRPTERAITAEKQASEKRTKDIGGWWNEYLKEVAGSQAATAAGSAAAAQQGANYITASSAADNANTSALDSQAAASAAARGQTYSPQAAERGAASQAQRNYLSSALGAAAATRAATEGAYFGKQRDIGAEQRATSRTAQSKTTQKIEKDRTELKKQRGEYATTKLGELQDKNRSYLIQKKAYGLDTKKYLTAKGEGKAAAATAAKEATTAASTAASAAARENKQETAAEKQAKITNRQNQEKIDNETGPGEKKAGEKKEDRHEAWVQLNTLYKSSSKKPKNSREWHEWAAALTAEYSIAPTTAAWAVETFRKKLGRQAEAKAAQEAETGANTAGPGGSHR